MNVALAKEVRARILAEPKRVYMGEWILKITKFLQREQEENHIDYGFDSYKALSCGTVGCIAGHTVLAALRPGMVAQCDDNGNVEDTAQALLGLNPYEAEGLFFFHEDEFRVDGEIHDSIYPEEQEALKSLKPGTKKYAQVVARVIDKCIERNS